MTNAANTELATRKSEKSIQKMLNATRDSLSNLASSSDEEDGEVEHDNEEETELGQLSNDDKLSWAR
jgi:hypothetical protein